MKIDDNGCDVKKNGSHFFANRLYIFYKLKNP